MQQIHYQLVFACHLILDLGFDSQYVSEGRQNARKYDIFVLWFARGLQYRPRLDHSRQVGDQRLQGLNHMQKFVHFSLGQQIIDKTEKLPHHLCILFVFQTGRDHLFNEEFHKEMGWQCQRLIFE